MLFETEGECEGLKDFDNEGDTETETEGLLLTDLLGLFETETDPDKETERLLLIDGLWLGLSLLLIEAERLGDLDLESEAEGLTLALFDLEIEAETEGL